LKCWINIYNQNYSDKPPNDHKVKKWNPQSIPPFDFENKNENQHSHQTKQKPFANASSKSSTKPSINSLDTPFSTDINIKSSIDSTADKLVQFDTLGTPAMSSFLTDQTKHAENLQFIQDDDDPYNHTACSMQLIPGTNQLITSPDHIIRNRTSQLPALSTTPITLQHAISNAHCRIIIIIII
jgi:hypothetical protein